MLTSSSFASWHFVGHTWLPLGFDLRPVPSERHSCPTDDKCHRAAWEILDVNLNRQHYPTNALVHQKSVLSRLCAPVPCRRWRGKVGYSALWRSQDSPAGVVTHCEQAESVSSSPVIAVTRRLAVLLSVHSAVWFDMLVALVCTILCICVMCACFKTIS